MRSFVRSFVRSLVRSFARSLVRSFARSLVRSLSLSLSLSLGCVMYRARRYCIIIIIRVRRTEWEDLLHRIPVCRSLSAGNNQLEESTLEPRTMARMHVTTTCSTRFIPPPQQLAERTTCCSSGARRRRAFLKLDGDARGDDGTHTINCCTINNTTNEVLSKFDSYSVCTSG